MTAWESLIILMTEVQIFLNKTWSRSSLSTSHPNNRHQLEPWTPQCQPFYTYSVRPRQHGLQLPFHYYKQPGHRVSVKVLGFIIFKFLILSYTNQRETPEGVIYMGEEAERTS